MLTSLKGVVVRKNSVDRRISSRSQCYIASPYLVDFEVGRSFREPQTRQQVVQQKFALRVKARFNPFRDSAGCTIVTQWQRKLKSNSSEDQTLLLETRARHGSHFLRAFFAGRRISPPSKTEVFTSSGRKSFDTGATIWRTTADSSCHAPDCSCLGDASSQSRPPKSTSWICLPLRYLLSLTACASAGLSQKSPRT